MKQLMLSLMIGLLMVVGGKELRVLVLTPTPVMHCESCENTIKNNMRFEKGVVKIETSLEQQTVAITYNPAKTNPDALRAAMKKIGRDTQVLSDKPLDNDKKKSKKK